MRKALFILSPVLASLAACAQTPAKPAVSSTPAAATASAQPGTPAPPAHPITDAQAHELMELNGTAKLKQELTEYLLRNFKQAPFMPKDVIDDLTASLDKADIEGGVAATYKKYLSTEDAAKIIEFYKTPAGMQLEKVTPEMMGEIQRNAMMTGQQTAREVVDKHRAEIEAAQKAYQAAHAPAAPARPMGAAPAKPGSPSNNATSPSDPTKATTPQQ